MRAGFSEQPADSRVKPSVPHEDDSILILSSCPPPLPRRRRPAGREGLQLYFGARSSRVMVAWAWGRTGEGRGGRRGGEAERIAGDSSSPALWFPTEKRDCRSCFVSLALFLRKYVLQSLLKGSSQKFAKYTRRNSQSRGASCCISVSNELCTRKPQGRGEPVVFPGCKHSLR